MMASKKVYCIDSGIIKALSFKSSLDIGKLMENLVAVELQRRKSCWQNNSGVYYWKDHHQQREVDFVIKGGEKVMFVPLWKWLLE